MLKIGVIYLIWVLLTLSAFSRDVGGTTGLPQVRIHGKQDGTVLRCAIYIRKMNATAQRKAATLKRDGYTIIDGAGLQTKAIIDRICFL